MSPDELFKIAEFLKQNSHHVEDINLYNGKLNFTWSGEFATLDKLDFHLSLCKDNKTKKYSVEIM